MQIYQLYPNVSCPIWYPQNQYKKNKQKILFGEKNEIQ